MATSTTDRPRTRAKKACLACNARRVRCNVMETQPCRNCLAWNLSCELGVSRRGKYPRKKKLAPEAECPKAGVSPNAPAQRQYVQQTPLQDLAHTYALSAHTRRTDDSIQKTVFLGESSPLTCVVDEGQRSPEKGYACDIHKGRLHYSISELHATAETNKETVRQRGQALQERLDREDALAFPSPAVCEVLIRAYFEWFHPLFPILDRARVQCDYQERTISPLLLQAMLFIGVSLCSDSGLNTAGFINRYKTKALFYHCAKALYDVGWETDTMVRLQAIFLLSFWRGGPTEERDVRYWLGVATDLAQKKGMHVMSKLTFLGARDQKTWKRIWWALYVRDQQTSAALGLPSRIRDEDCEVADLQDLDFEEDDSSNPSDVFRKPPPAHVYYVIQMAELAKLLRAIISSQYLPGKSKLENPERPALHQRLLHWESTVPPEMQFQPSMAREVLFLAGMLHMAYANLCILLYRPIFLQPPDRSSSTEGNFALEAATKSTRILEDMLSQNLVQHGSVHLITHTFSALCIHTIQFGRSTSTAKKLAEHRAKLCLLGLKELQKSWDLENWVLDLFFHCLDDCTARNLRLIDSGMSASTLSSHLSERQQNSEQGPLEAPKSDVNRPSSPIFHDSTLPGLPTAVASTELDGTSVNMDWYELFNVDGDDAAGLAGPLTNPDYLNPQNLEVLYRFL